ncbi:hypothetical protein ACFWAZ_35105 [Streptomyces collinus]|uniref:hypothetical protein n=1 Tax=Streptomyces collinus TaxID=42684 RepID=UPI00365C4DB5
MSATSVALVSAGGAVLGAIAGGVITGLTTTRNTRIQAQSQREGERIAREHGQLDKHIEIRRAAYTELLHGVTELSECWASILNAPAADSSDDLRDALTAARQAANNVKRRTIVVVLEGPPLVAEMAGQCSSDAITYLQAILRVYQSNTAPPSDATVRDIVGDRCDQEEDAAHSSYAAFIRTARETLGGHL